VRPRGAGLGKGRPLDRDRNARRIERIGHMQEDHLRLSGAFQRNGQHVSEQTESTGVPQAVLEGHDANQSVDIRGTAGLDEVASPGTLRRPRIEPEDEEV
jgi:hypothetical protein